MNIPVQQLENVIDEITRKARYIFYVDTPQFPGINSASQGDNIQ